MRVDHQLQSMHYFHSFATLDRVDFSGLSTERVAKIPSDIMAIPSSAILPNAADCMNLRSNYVVTVARIVAERLPYFNFLLPCLPRSSHQYSKNMCQKSETVSTLLVQSSILSISCIKMYT